MLEESSPSQRDFERLFEANELALRLHARALLPSWDAVDEVMQTSSLIMWKKLAHLDDDDGFLPWGKCIIRFESQKYFRTKSRDHLVFDPDLLELLSKHDEESEMPCLKQEEAALTRCLEALGSASRKLVLAPYQGHGHLTELALASGRTRNSLYKQIRRIRGKLEQCVTQQMEGRT